MNITAKVDTYLKANRLPADKLPATHKVFIKKGTTLTVDRRSDPFDGHFAVSLVIEGRFLKSYWAYVPHFS